MSCRWHMRRKSDSSEIVDFDLRRLSSRTVALIMTLAAVIMVLSAPSSALADRVEGDSPLSLTVKARCECDDFEQGQVRIWRVAQVGANGMLVPDPAYEGVSDNWNVVDASDVRRLAGSLEEYVAKRDIAPSAAAPLGLDGIAEFSAGLALEPGCYLIVGPDHELAGGMHCAMPTLMFLPYVYVDGSRDFSPTVAMKYTELFEEEGEVPTVTPEPDPGEKLPQTGQLWWPVAVLLVAGVALVALGVSKRLRG